MARFRATLAKAAASASLAVGAVYNPGAAMRLTEIEHFTFGGTGTMADTAFEVQVQRSTTAPTGGTAVTPLPINPAAQAAVVLAMAAPTTNGTVTANQFLLDITCHARNMINLWIRNDCPWLIPATANNGVHVMTPVITALALVSTLQFNE